MVEEFDICIIGGGVAGLSVAAGLASGHKVVLVERETHWAYHATGRSAALFAESYGNAAVRALTRASRDFYFGCGGAQSFTQPRQVLFVAAAAEQDGMNALQTMLSAMPASVVPLDSDAALRLCPALRPEFAASALLDRDARDIDVAAVVEHYARQFRSRGGRQCRAAEVVGLECAGDEWHIRAGGIQIRAAIVVNAAGAWADEVARAAGVAAAGLEPRRRTAVRVSAGSWAVGQWPCVIDASERWYFRPDAGSLLLSPADETPSVPCDAQPDDYDIALAIERVEAATRLVIDRPLSAWAGLRTFAADRAPIVGFDPDARGFYWMAGQGGYGIQMAPALALLAAAQINGHQPAAELAAAGVDAAALSPARLR
jgi:D-arginine dehydrogenase